MNKVRVSSLCAQFAGLERQALRSFIIAYEGNEPFQLLDAYNDAIEAVKGYNESMKLWDSGVREVEQQIIA